MASCASARCVVFANRKGGCGKTTTAVNVAHALAIRQKKVLVIDLDPQAHTTLSFGIYPDGLKASAFDFLGGKSCFEEIAIQTGIHGLTLIPASRNLTQLEMDPLTHSHTETSLAEHLEGKSGLFDYIVIDPPPAVGMLSTSALVAAREVFIPMPMHFLSMEGLAEMMRLIYTVNARWNPQLKLQGIIPTFFNRNTRIAKEICQEISKNFGEDKLMLPGIRMNISLAEAPGSGLTIFDYAPRSIGASDYGLLAERIDELGSK